MFYFKEYHFDPDTHQASFCYVGVDGTEFTEVVQFTKSLLPINDELLDRALFLSFILIGTSYYKANPTAHVRLDIPIDKSQALFFNTVYQEGLSQFAFENQLTRQDLAHFTYTNAPQPQIIHTTDYHGVLSLQSGGKDSLLTATLCQQQPTTYLYIGSSNHYPKILDQLGGTLQLLERTIDREHLLQAAGMNGHVPITYIIQSLALVQAIINHNSTILTSIGREGNEAHAYIDDLPVNHQWSKTWPAELAFAQYVHTYISPDIQVGSPLRGFSELKIAELFTKYCWQKYGHSFSSCNIANYRQNANNETLSWCGNCAKCANTYLLFAPFIPAQELKTIFAGEDLFTKPSLTDTFKGLLGIDGFMKPFECIGEIAELRKAYHLRQSDYGSLPFDVPESDFDSQEITQTQAFVQNFIKELA